MNKNEEGKYYASMVRKFRIEYEGKNLQGFCRDQKVSYTKMLHCMRSSSYRKYQTESSGMSGEQGLHPLVIEGVSSVAKEPAVAVSEERIVGEMRLEDIELSFGTRVSLHIGSCTRSALVSLVKEMEEVLC